MSETTETVNVPTLHQMAKVGATMGADRRPATGWKFYRDLGLWLGDLAGKARAAKAEQMRDAMIKIKFGDTPYTEADLKASRLPSVDTMTKTSRLPARFVDADETIALEVYATAARHETIESDAAAVTAVKALALKLGGAPSINDARDEWPSASGKGGRGKSDETMTVAEHVAWLIGQPAAVAAYRADDANLADIVTLVTMLAGTAETVAAA